MSEPRKVVIVGGGFGGLSAAQHALAFEIAIKSTVR
jgi:NADH dehydrogenase FAD-containing subunit